MKIWPKLASILALSLLPQISGATVNCSLKKETTEIKKWIDTFLVHVETFNSAMASRTSPPNQNVARLFEADLASLKLLSNKVATSKVHQSLIYGLNAAASSNLQSSAILATAYAKQPFLTPDEVKVVRANISDGKLFIVTSLTVIEALTKTPCTNKPDPMNTKDFHLWVGQVTKSVTDAHVTMASAATVKTDKEVLAIRQKLARHEAYWKTAEDYLGSKHLDNLNNSKKVARALLAQDLKMIAETARLFQKSTSGTHLNQDEMNSLKFHAGMSKSLAFFVDLLVAPSQPIAQQRTMASEPSAR